MKKDLFSGLSKKNFDLKKFKELKRILSKQGIVIKRKPFSNINFRFDEFKSLLEKTFENSTLTDSTYLVRDRHIKLFGESVVSLGESYDKLEVGGPLELAAEDLKMARSCLDGVVGLKTADSLLGDIFSSFCIGK